VAANPDAQRLAELAALVDAVKERVRAQYPDTTADGPAGAVCVGLPDLKPLERARDAAAGKMAAIGTVNPRQGGVANSLIQAVKRTVARALNWFVRDQVIFNRQMITCVEVCIETLNNINRTIHVVAGQANTEIQRVRAEAEPLRREAEILRMKASEFEDLVSHWNRWREEWQLKLHENEVEFLKSVADLNTTFHQKVFYVESAAQQHEAEFRKSVADLNAVFQQKASYIESAAQQRFAQAEGALEQRVADLRTRYEQQASALNERYQQHAALIDAACLRLDAAFQKSATELDASYRQTATELDISYRQTAMQLEATCQETAARVLKDFADTVAPMEAGFRQNVTQLENSYRESLTRSDASFRETLGQAETSFRETLNQAEAGFEKKVSQLETAYVEQIAQFDRRATQGELAFQQLAASNAEDIQTSVTAQISALADDAHRSSVAMDQRLVKQAQDFEGLLAASVTELQKKFYADLDRIRTEYERVIHAELRVVRQRLAAGAAATAAAPRADAETPSRAGGLPFDYARFADRFRGSEEYVTESQRFYLRYFNGRRHVLDIGCGRGEFLKLMREAGVPAKGIEASGESVEHCRSLGIEAEKSDLFTYLTEQPEGSLDGIFCSQVVEHLPPDRLPEMVRLCATRLATGGILAIETPNPECLAIFGTHFYLDPTHTRPVPSQLLAFYMEESGLGRVEVHAKAPAVESIPEVGELPAGFRERFFGGLDYAIIGYRL
jgi:2-polyprenyl-3-methyl-5-hydroxy-6-metoxy-1,4-benzoquinol methylase